MLFVVGMGKNAWAHGGLSVHRSVRVRAYLRNSLSHEKIAMTGDAAVKALADTSAPAGRIAFVRDGKIVHTTVHSLQHLGPA